jgi:hypothetical protein
MNKNQSIDYILNSIIRHKELISYGIEVDDDQLIRGISFDLFLNNKNIIVIYICLHTPILSCCGLGGEFNANNTLIPDVRNKNYEIIKDVMDYSVFQYLVPIPKSYYFEDENKKLDSLKNANKKKEKMKK